MAKSFDEILKNLSASDKQMLEQSKSKVIDSAATEKAQDFVTVPNSIKNSTTQTASLVEGQVNNTATSTTLNQASTTDTTTKQAGQTLVNSGTQITTPTPAAAAQGNSKTFAETTSKPTTETTPKPSPFQKLIKKLRGG